MGELFKPLFPTVLMDQRVAFETEEWMPLHVGNWYVAGRSNAWRTCGYLATC